MFLGRTFAVVAPFLLIAAAAAAPDPGAAPPAATSNAAIPLSYVGSNLRIGASIDQDGELQGEALSVLGYNGARALLTEGWLGRDGAGGLQMGYHWLWGGRTREDTIQRPADVIVAKAFLAFDQNRLDDRKGSIGVGLERNAYGLDVYYSRALTDERLLASDTAVSTETVFGDENGRPFRQEVTIDTLTERFEHPYDHGIGLRLSRYLEESLLRVRGGLDYEIGDTLLQGDEASQLTVSVALEKQFHDSGHSVGLELEHLRKDGPFDPSVFGDDSEENRFRLLWRYEFGRSFRPTQNYRETEIVRTVQPPPPQPEVFRTELQLASQALFALNRAEVTDSAKSSLRDLVKQIGNRRVGTVDIVGHTCDLGSDEHNQNLSERRAAAVRDWLISEGIPADALVASGRGEREPSYPNDSDENRARNRRITLSFLSFEEKVVTAKQAAPQRISEWVREAVPTPAAWIERALRTPSAHKRAVDSYRIERVTQTRTEGPRVFINRPPIAVSDAAVVVQGASITIPVLANDSDPDGDVLELVVVSAAPNGSAVANADGTITYTPNAAFVGADTFTYTIRDPEGQTAAATVTVTAEPPNQPPVAADDAASTAENQAVIIEVLSNDTDAEDGSSLDVTIVNDPLNGSVSLNGGVVTYTPNPGFSGEDRFDYTVTDTGGLSDTAEVVVRVIDNNRPPTALDDTGAILFPNDPETTIFVLVNDSDPDPGDLPVITSVTQPAHGMATFDALNGTVTYTFTSSLFFPTDSFTYTIADSGGLTATATVNITVNVP
jgi:outer membrane protein OmpA-like peptidoglycan-associated protein